jgi:ribose transport system ATP-binding protein
MNPIIQLEHIDKTFPGVKALTDIDVSFYSGEVHSLVGENGAGKSTLIKILLGAYQPTGGIIRLDGKSLHIKNPFEASKLGIEGVHQELMLIPWLSVAQNIFVNREIKNPKTGLYDNKKMEEISRNLLSEFGIEIDVSLPVKGYSASIWKMIDIARVINLNPRVIIFDEPTAILTEREVYYLFKKILELRDAGVAIVYISHRLNEINQITNRITVLRDGYLIKTTMAENVNEDDIVKLMVGRDITSYYKRNIKEKGKELLRLENVSLKKGQKNISLNVHKGEIVGLAGLVSSGRTEIAESLFGMNKILSGKIFVNEKEIVPQSPKEMIDEGIFLVPENRKYQGLILNFSVATNIALSVFRRWSKFFYSNKKESENADRMIEALDIKTPTRKQLVRNLSGGNQQKIVIGKAMGTGSKFIVFDEPTVGVDVGAKEEIYNLMDSFVNEGGGVLMISSDLPEVIGMSDRVYVMYEGRIVKELLRNEISEETIAEYMLGSKQEAIHA